jgi:predicted dehydrogenase
MDKLRVGIAGYGIVGKRRHLFIDTHPNLKVVAICDQNFDIAVTNSLQVSIYKDYQNLLDCEELDILFVCLTNNIAAEVTIAALKKNLHVFCEKPPGLNVEEIKKVISVEKANPNLKLKYGFNHRYHDSVKMAMKIIQSGELGEIVNLRGVYGKSRIIPFSGGWRSNRKLAGGGILLDQGIHMLDLMRLFCGNFSEVKSFVSNDFWNHDVEDNAFAIMKDNRGRVAMIHSSATQWQHKFSLEISLTKGYIELHGILSGSKSYGEEKIIIGGISEESNDGQMEHTTTRFLEDNSWKEEVFEFASAIIEGNPILSGTSSDALETMKLVYNIYYSDEIWRNKYNISNPNIN